MAKVRFAGDGVTHEWQVSGFLDRKSVLKKCMNRDWIHVITHFISVDCKLLLRVDDYQVGPSICVNKVTAKPLPQSVQAAGLIKVA